MSKDGLEQLRRELLSAADRRSKRQTQNRWSRGFPVLIVAVALGGGTAAAVTTITEEPNDPSDPVLTARTVPLTPGSAPRPLSRSDLARIRAARSARSPTISATKYFSVLALPARSSDVLPSLNTGRVRRTKPKDAVRLTVANDAGRVYVRSTRKEVCIYVFGPASNAGASTTCTPTLRARDYGAFTVAQCSAQGPPQRRVFGGVAPDGVDIVDFRRDGVSQVRTPVVRNGYAVVVDQPVNEVKVGRFSITLPRVSC